MSDPNIDLAAAPSPVWTKREHYYWTTPSGPTRCCSRTARTRRTTSTAASTDEPRRRTDDALRRAFAHALLGSIVVDCDHPDAAMRAFEQPRNHPAPNWVAQSPPGAHTRWWLGPNPRPSAPTPPRLTPLRYAHRIEPVSPSASAATSPTADNSPRTPSTPTGKPSTAPRPRTRCASSPPSTPPGKHPAGPTAPPASAATSPCSTPPENGPTPSGWHHRDGGIDAC
ncbi:hypothetical protein GS441_27025 [Rhodococcus hoagii]|uniref:Uncharacterized protein n=1 Tax=Rhodococcus hoagii TaxID=43767 RepID=A0A9Q2SBT0_RHOHA|nr:hypothetical protein [Prescottella equi]